jgi:hypothetical protein
VVKARREESTAMVNVFIMRFQGSSASSLMGRLILEVVAVVLYCFVLLCFALCGCEIMSGMNVHLYTFYPSFQPREFYFIIVFYSCYCISTETCLPYPRLDQRHDIDSHDQPNATLSLPTRLSAPLPKL